MAWRASRGSCGGPVPSGFSWLWSWSEPLPSSSSTSVCFQPWLLTLWGGMRMLSAQSMPRHLKATPPSCTGRSSQQTKPDDADEDQIDRDDDVEESRNNKNEDSRDQRH